MECAVAVAGEYPDGATYRHGETEKSANESCAGHDQVGYAVAGEVRDHGVRAIRRRAWEREVSPGLEGAVAIAQQHGERAAGPIICHDIELVVRVEVSQSQVGWEEPRGRTESGRIAQVAFAIAQHYDNAATGWIGGNHIGFAIAIHVSNRHAANAK